MKYRNSIAATALLGMAIVAAPASAQEKQGKDQRHQADLSDRACQRQQQRDA
jgi:hypothetical protein